MPGIENSPQIPLVRLVQTRPERKGGNDLDIERIAQFIAETTALPGVPGYETGVNGRIAEWFRPLADDVFKDDLENLYARVGAEGRGPRVIVCAHQDEIGLVVSKIEDDGSLRIFKNGGVDPRILPGMEVSVQTASGPLYGVIGAKPPQLLTSEDREKALKLEDLYVDVGYQAEEVRARVRVGDMVVMLAPSLRLANGCMAGKTMDDRASVAAMLVAAELLSQRSVPAETYFVSTTQEEIGSVGAKSATFRLKPDLAIVIDVTHGEGPGTGKWEAYPVNKVTVAHGPNIQPKLEKIAVEAAKENGVDTVMEVCTGVTATDACETQTAAGGVPSLLLSIPLKYMHTSVELLKLDTVRETGRLIALVIEKIAREWEGFSWF